MKQQRYTFDDLREIMAQLRDPKNGCPWDIQQNFATIAPYTIEEAYEVADAIEREDLNDLREELGDLLLQPVYHAQMASEQNIFDLDDVIHDIAEKMVRRHPHVFGDADARSPEDVNKIWDQKKDQEKCANQSVLDGVPKAFPALLRAQKLQKKAAKTGFEWHSINGVIAKLNEEIQELREAVAADNSADIEEEFGDVLFVLVNFARMNGINAETALRRTNDKFVQRFQGMENDLGAENKKMDDLDIDEMLELWDKQKTKNNFA